MRELNLTCLKVPENNEIGHFAPSFWPEASIPSSDHLSSIQAKPFHEKVKMKRLTLRKFNLREFNLTCLKPPESNKINNFACGASRRVF